jgi:hypothetical protein
VSGDTSRIALLLALSALLLAPATAVAAAPWSAPTAVAGAIGQSAPVAVTPAGSAALVAGVSRDAPGFSRGPSVLVSLSPDGEPGTPQPVSVAAA